MLLIFLKNWLGIRMKEALKKRKSRKILIIDDEAVIRDGCQQVLVRKGYHVDCAGDAHEGLQMGLRNSYDVILLDVRMPNVSGMDILKKLKEENNVNTRVIMITGYGTIPLAVEAMRQGACNVLTKPYSAAELNDAVSMALEDDDQIENEQNHSLMIGCSDYMKELKDSIRRIALTDSTVLITGSSGTGKELVARTIHQLSQRADRPFIPVDCSSLSENLMESELFGHVRGAFSGATETREGRFQMADTGTLFLDEISNINLNIQAKLLRVIQEREVPRVGKSSPEKVDVRLIAATNRDLHTEIAVGKFREDLFYRLSVVPLDIKPLTDHKADILPIAEHYLDFYQKKHKSKVRNFSEEAKKSLQSYKWPGNVRELKNTIERLCVLCDNETVNLSDIFYYGQSEGTQKSVVYSLSDKATLVDVEKEHIKKALRHFHFQMNKTAKFLGIDRKTLRLKMRNYNIDSES
jgi:DNA-binding NtrC family response regulator